MRGKAMLLREGYNRGEGVYTLIHSTGRGGEKPNATQRGERGNALLKEGGVCRTIQNDKYFPENSYSLISMK